MTVPVFRPLFEHYPTTIALMDNSIFTSHEFILKLAQQHQVPYIEALHYYLHSPDEQHPTPFKIVHGILAKHLRTHGDLVRYAGETESIDIFTRDNRCAQWERI